MGTGTRDIIAKCLHLGLKQPDFLQTEDFKVTLWRIKNEGIKNELQSIYIYIKNNPLTKTADVEKFIGKSKATAERYLKILKDNNRIEYSGSLKTGGYKIIKEQN